MVETKDVILGALGAAAALAGFQLVFLGFLISAYQAFDPQTPPRVLAPYRSRATWVASAFVVSLLTVAACFLWLVDGGPDNWYVWTVALFVGQLVTVLIAAVNTMKQVFWT